MSADVKNPVAQEVPAAAPTRLLRDKLEQALEKADDSKLVVVERAVTVLLLIDILGVEDSASVQLDDDRQKRLAYKLERTHLIYRGVDPNDFKLTGDTLFFTAEALAKVTAYILRAIDSAIPAEKVTVAEGQIEQPADETSCATEIIEPPATPFAKPARQNLDALPPVIRDALRYFAVGTSKNPKQPTTPNWNTPQNQKNWRDITGSAGFDTSGHGAGVDYLFVDFDHVLDEKGDWLYPAAEEVYNALLKISPDIYIEKSISGTGLHAFLIPTDGKFPPVASGGNGAYYLTDERGKDAPKIEFFYKTKGRYCLLTGWHFRNAGNVVPNAKDYPAVDVFFENMLKKIAAQNRPADEDTIFEKVPVAEIAAQQTQKTFTHTHSVLQNDNDFDAARVRRMLELIDPAALDYGEWLALMTAAKCVNVSYEEIDAFNQRDAARYNERENLATWNAAANTGYDEGVIYNLAVKFGYNAEEFTREYYGKNPRATAKVVAGSGDAGGLTPAQRDAVFNQIVGGSDLANARRFISIEGDEIRYLEKDDRWLIYDPPRGIWIPGGKGKNTALLPKIISAADKIAAAATSDFERAIAAPFASARKIAGLTAFVKGLQEVRITAEELDKDPFFLNVLNGRLDLRDGKLYPHSPESYMTKCAPVIYRAGYRNAEVDEFLSEIQPDEDNLMALLIYLGYCATGEIGVEKFLVMQGGGANGKGTLTRTFLKMLGDYGTALRPAALLKGKTSDANAATTALNVLIGKRYAIVDEFSQGDRLDVATVKRITGGDTLTFRALYEEESPVDLTVKLLFSSNYQIQVDDVNDGGLLRRFMYLPFTQDFSSRADTTLKSRLLQKDCFSGLLTRIVEGAQWYYSHGGKLYESPAMIKARAGYLDDQDWIGAFVREYCVFDPQAAIPCSVFYRKLRAANERISRRYDDNVLREMICRIDGITYESRHYYPDLPRNRNRKASYVGIDWQDKDEDFLPPDL